MPKLFAVVGLGLACCLAPDVADAFQPQPSEGAINTTRSNIKNTFRVPGPSDPRTIVTPIEILFEDPQSYDDFAARRLPFVLTLRNAASGQIVRFDPLVLDGFRPAADRRLARLDVKIDNVDAPLLARGCLDTDTEALPLDGGRRVAVTVTYSPCRPATTEAGAQETATPIKGIGVVIKKPPYDNARLTVTTGYSQVGVAAAQWLTARTAQRESRLVIRAEQGSRTLRSPGF